MELKVAIEGRRSIRRFTKEAVPKKDLEEIIRLAALAPSAGNAQMWHFIVITDPEKIAELAGTVAGKLEEFEIIPIWPNSKSLFCKCATSPCYSRMPRR